MTIHVLGMAHTELTAAYETCAYTARTRDFATMLHRAGHRVIVYGGERAEVEAAEHVTLVTRAEQAEWWPWYSPAGQVPFNDFDLTGIGWRTWNERAAAALRARVEPHDIVAVTMGIAQRPALDAVADLQILAVETGIGYSGVWAPYRVYESRAWQHYLAAREPTDDLRAFDTVIPRAYPADAFPAGTGAGGYHLFIGRLTARKGPHVAALACQRLGARLVVAGQGVASVEPGRITTTDGLRLEGDVEYAGVVGPAERARLMGDAIAVWAPTQYLEPGGGVAIEAQLTGTPAITTDYGCFTETVTDGGIRCRTLAEFVEAGRQAGDIARSWTRTEALGRYTFDAVAPMFGAYFQRLDTLWRSGWYEVSA